MTDQRVCRTDDRGERPVILHQLDRAAVFVALWKPEHDRGRRSPPGVDRLIRITDDEKIAIQFGKNIGKRRLIVTHVLVLNVVLRQASRFWAAVFSGWMDYAGSID